MSLTKKQQIFIDEYLKCFNATEAARRAGYSDKTAYAIGWENLRKPEIAEHIEKRLEENAMSANEVLARLADMARGDIGEMLDISSVGYNLDLLQAKQRGLTKLIKKVKQRTTTYLGRNDSDEDREITELEIELYDAQAALVHLGKYHKLFSDRIEHTIDIQNLRQLSDDELRAIIDE